jgi:PAS domain S-box-containing protein
MSATAELHSPERIGTILRRLFLGVTITAGALVLAASVEAVVRRPPGAAWAVLLVVTCATALAIVRLPGFPVSFSPTDALTITAALFFGPAAGALCVAADTLIGSLRLSRPHRTLTTVLFNVTGPPLAMFLAADLFFRLGGARHVPTEGPTFASTVVPLAAFATVYFALNTWLVATAVTAGRGRSLLRVWRDHFAPLWLTHFGGTSVAGLLLLSMQAGLFNVETFLVALPLIVVLGMAFGTAVGRIRRRSAEYDELRSYAAALRSTADAVLLTDAAGRVTLMNPMAERLTGWTQAEARGRPGTEIFRTVGPALPALDSSLNATGPSLAEAVLVRRDGGGCPIEESHAYIREEDGTISGTIRTFRDITARKSFEAERQALLEREKAARVAADVASRSKDEFLATLSHELRTPVMAIAGWIKLLKEGRVQGDQAEKALASADRTVRAQAAVLDDLLDLSRIIRGTLKLSPRPTAVGEVLQEACETVEPAVHAKHIALRIDVDPDLPAVDADPDRLRQVFWNVLSNAVKFTPAEGSIAVSASLRGGAIRVVVADTGCGIQPEFLPFVFDRFRQADSSDTRRYQGLGLGLAIVRHLVEAHGGTVSAASDGPDRGARITIDLPLAGAGDRQATKL